MVKTVTLATNTPQKIAFEGGAYPYYWLDNKSTSDVYASVGGTPEADKDDTYTVAAGSQMRISGGVGNDGITLLGEGKVQIIASTIAACPFKAALGGGGIKFINGHAAADGALVLTQSLIPSDGVAYQMPFYVQSGTMTVGKSALDGIDITFPQAFKAAPLIIFGASVNPSYAKYPTAASYNNLTNEGFTLIASRVGSSGASTIPDAAPCVVNWVALGQLEV